MVKKSLAVLDALGQTQSDRRIAVLRQIGERGSISQAARAVGVSYKAAWQALDTLTNLAGVALVERLVGGAGGGGARLTSAGHELLAAADAMGTARAQVLQHLVGRGVAHAAAAHLAVRTSMRNQWPCVVEQVLLDGPVAQVRLRPQVGAGLIMQARLTRESLELLDLAPGVVAQVLCKATAVQVLARSAAQAENVVNQWPGRVVRMARGAQEDEVAVQLDGGLQLVGFAAAGLGLRVRSRVVASASPSALALMVQAG